jgi:pimeloyl-ACP methyl ester carboxylesterase
VGSALDRSDRDRRASAAANRPVFIDGGKPHDPKAYGEQMSLDIIRLMDHMKVSRAHVIGYSMGAIIVAKLLTTHPERFITATLGGASARRPFTRQITRPLKRKQENSRRGLLSVPWLGERGRATSALPRRSNCGNVVCRRSGEATIRWPSPP